MMNTALQWVEKYVFKSKPLFFLLLVAIAILPKILSSTIVVRNYPAIDIFMNKIDSLWVSIISFASLLSYLLLIIFIILFIFNKIATAMDNKNKLKNQINSLIGMSNDAKYILCHIFETIPKGSRIEYRYHDNEKQIALEEMLKVGCLVSHHPTESRRASANGDSYMINPDIYKLLSDNNNKAYKILDKSIPESYIEHRNREIEKKANQYFNNIYGLPKHTKKQIVFLYKNIKMGDIYTIYQENINEHVPIISSLSELSTYHLVEREITNYGYNFKMIDDIYHLFDDFPELYKKFIESLDN